MFEGLRNLLFFCVTLHIVGISESVMGAYHLCERISFRNYASTNSPPSGFLKHCGDCIAECTQSRNGKTPALFCCDFVFCIFRDVLNFVSSSLPRAAIAFPFRSLHFFCVKFPFAASDAAGRIIISLSFAGRVISMCRSYRKRAF